MRLPALVFLLLLTSITGSELYAQMIKGEVTDMQSKKPMSDVSITNIYNDITVTTGAGGAFTIAANNDELVEFKKTGYKTVRVRVPKGYTPSYFKIVMQPGFARLEDMLAENDARYKYHEDSLRDAGVYNHELIFPRQNVLSTIESPFSALSKHNRDIWRFQQDYDEFEKTKYVDRVFNESVITRFTGLTGDSLHHFMVRYRPSYEQLRSMGDYTFFAYIKMAAARYRYANTPRNSQ